MENQETIFELKGIEEKESKAGKKYYICKNGNDTYSCFESKIIEELNKNIGKRVRVEIVESEKGFKNIRKFLGAIETEKVGLSKGISIEESRAEKAQSVYTSYAKDIFLELAKIKESDLSPEERMNVAIALVKQAREAFK